MPGGIHDGKGADFCIKRRADEKGTLSSPPRDSWLRKVEGTSQQLDYFFNDIFKIIVLQKLLENITEYLRKLQGYSVKNTNNFEKILSKF